MFSFKRLCAFVAVLFCMGSVSQAAITFAFQANSVNSNPLFTMGDSDPGPGVALTLQADNLLDLTVDVNGNLHTYDDAAFHFSANVSSIMSFPGIGTFYTLTDVAFVFETGDTHEVIVEAGSTQVRLYVQQGMTVATLAASTETGDIYTVGPALTALLTNLGLNGPLADEQDYAFSMAGIQTVAGGPTVPGGSVTANASFVGTGAIIPVAPTFVAGLAILGAMGLRRRFAC